MKTKIINIQKSDAFDEVLESVSKADAQEVIMIFPKGSIFSREAAYFDALKVEADSGGKKISVMSSDPIIARLADTHGIAVLQAPQRKTPSKVMKDIIGHADDSKVEIKQAKEKEIEVPVNTEQKEEKIEEVAQNDPGSDIEKLWQEEETVQNPVLPVDETTKRKWWKKIPKWGWIGLVCALVLIVAGAILLRPGTAKITLNPKQEEVDVKLKVTVSKTLEGIAEDSNKIPGQIIKVQSEKKGSYPTTSEKEVAQKATGTIKIFNKTASAQKFVATTRFESEGGFIFRIPQSISVPANGSIESEVYADRAGKDYNIPAGKFVVFAFKGQPNASDFYATSSAPMTGGFIGNAKVVAENDFVKAKEALVAEVKKELEELLKQQLGEMVTASSPEPVIREPEVNAKVGEAADNLEMTLRGSYELMAFKPENALVLINRYLQKNGNLEASLSDLTIKYSIISADKDSDISVIEARAIGKARLILDTAKIISEIKGLTEAEVQKYFEGKAVGKILLSPLWLRRIPNDESRISLTVEK